MNAIEKIIFIGSLCLVLLLGGCDLLTKTLLPQTVSGGGYGKDLVINEVFTISPDKYYAYSWIEILNTTNRPISWFNQTFPAIGIAVGSGGAITQTTDDGLNWVDTLSNGSLGNLNSVAYPNSDTGFICGNNGAVYKINILGNIISLNANLPAQSGGINYKTLNYYSVSGIWRYVGINHIDVQNKTAFLVGDSGVILRTLDRGNTWTQVPSGGLPAALHQRINNIYSAFTVDLAVGQGGMILMSTNAGTKWVQKNIPQSYRSTEFFSCWLIDTLAWATGANGAILQSTNSGNLWLEDTSNVTASLRTCFFGDPSAGSFTYGQGWVAGDNGTILMTEDYGATWKRVSSGTNARLNSIWFVDSLRGWAVGNGGVIVASTNGGRSWHAEASGTTSNLMGAFFQPLLITIQNGYYLSMRAQRNFVFYDAATQTLNPNFITKTDTGIILFEPTSGNINISSKGFVVVTNDSIKFQDHTKLGPGQTIQINYSFTVDTTGITQPNYNPFAHLLKWNLLPSTEIRLEKFYYKSVGATLLGYTTQTIDVVRWGHYRPTPDDYPKNVPAGYIPEYWSLARYNNDPGESPNVESTASSFYLCSQPIPGWYSQQGK